MAGAGTLYIRRGDEKQGGEGQWKDDEGKVEWEVAIADEWLIREHLAQSGS